jgi:5,10-methylenetetrahydromethanopterin reductase
MKISVASIGEEPHDRYLDYARLCELLGFDSFNHADEKWTRDVWVRLAVAGAATSRIGLGVTVTDPFTRHPAITAQAAATLAEATNGRFRLMLGIGSHFETLPGYGVVKGPLAMREMVEVMRAMWRNERVTFDGKVVKLDGATFDFDFDQSLTPEVYIAGRGPMALASAGRVADGVLIGSFATPPGIEWAKEQIGQGLEKAGRGWDDIKLSSWIYVTILDDPDEPLPDNIRRGMSHAMWSSRPFFAERLDQFSDDITDEFRTFMQDAPHEWSPEVMAQLRSVITRGMFDSLAVAGTEQQVIDKIAALRDAGVGEVVIWPFPRDGETAEDVVVRLAQTVIPALGTPVSRPAFRLVD